MSGGFPVQMDYPAVIGKRTRPDRKCYSPLLGETGRQVEEKMRYGLSIAACSIGSAMMRIKTLPISRKDPNPLS